MIVGAPLAKTEPNQEGAGIVFVYEVTAQGMNEVWHINGPAPGSRFGASVALGDANGDNVSDIVVGVIAAYQRIGGHGYRVWNLGSDRPVRLDAMIEAISRVVGKPARIKRLPMQPGDVERTWADLARSGAELGYRPRMGFEEGLREQAAGLT